MFDASRILARYSCEYLCHISQLFRQAVFWGDSYFPCSLSKKSVETCSKDMDEEPSERIHHVKETEKKHSSDVELCFFDAILQELKCEKSVFFTESSVV